MCGRYTLFNEQDNEEIRNIIQKVNEKYPEYKIKTGEIYPTNSVPVILQQGGKITPDLSVWGFPNYMKKGNIINARSETALDKKTFRASLLERRCAVPSTGFYEWSPSKEKVLFTLPESVLYMAGIYRRTGAESCFVILTTNANASVADIHDRMPVILTKEKIQGWITDTDMALSYLNEPMPLLNRSS